MRYGNSVWTLSFWSSGKIVDVITMLTDYRAERAATYMLRYVIAKNANTNAMLVETFDAMHETLPIWCLAHRQITGFHVSGIVLRGVIHQLPLHNGKSGNPHILVNGKTKHSSQISSLAHVIALGGMLLGSLIEGKGGAQFLQSHVHQFQQFRNLICVQCFEIVQCSLHRNCIVIEIAKRIHVACPKNPRRLVVTL